MKKSFITLIIILLTGKIMETQAQHLYANKENVAINGYDVVSYFTDTKATKGNSSISADYAGSHFYFISENHKKLFLENPKKYIPQFDGYCAYAVAAMNKKVPTNPETFKIIDGKLYLFFNDLYEGKPFNTLEPWNKNEANLLPSANTNWNTLKNQ